MFTSNSNKNTIAWPHSWYNCFGVAATKVIFIQIGKLLVFLHEKSRFVPEKVSKCVKVTEYIRHHSSVGRFEQAHRSKHELSNAKSDQA